MNLFCVGISHHTATVETRERYVGGAAEKELLATGMWKEALVLSTCNRVEIYGSSDRALATEEIMPALWQSNARREETDVFYRYDGETCAPCQGSDAQASTKGRLEEGTFQTGVASRTE